MTSPYLDTPARSIPEMRAELEEQMREASISYGRAKAEMEAASEKWLRLRVHLEALSDE